MTVSLSLKNPGRCYKIFRNLFFLFAMRGGLGVGGKFILQNYLSLDSWIQALHPILKDILVLIFIAAEE